MSEEAVAAGPATRRSPDEVRRLILESARTLFAEKGYAGTSIREIAEHAGVYEPMIYRRVGSKAELFQEAVLAPMNEVVASHLERTGSWQQIGPMTDVGRSWMEPLYRVIRENRALLLALLAAETFHSAEFEGATHRLSDGLRRLIEQTEPEAQLEVSRRDLPDVDVRANIMANLSMLIGMALLEGALGQDGVDYLGSDRAMQEMLRLVEFGIYRPGGGDGVRRTRMMSEAEFGRLLDRVADAERRATRAELELELLSGRPPEGRA